MSWLSDRLKEAQAQINPFDNGRTAATVRQQRAQAPPAQTVRGPQNTVFNNPVTRGVASVSTPRRLIGTVGRFAQQAPKAYNTLKDTQVAQKLNNPVTRFVDKAVIEPMVKTEGNLGTISQGRNPYKGSVRQQVGQASQDVINLASAAPVGAAASAGSKLLRGAAPLMPTIRSAAASGLKIGAGFGAAQGGSTALQQEQSFPQALRTIGTNTAVGAGLGAAGGAAAPLIGAGIRNLPRATQATASAARELDRRAFTPRVNLEDQRALQDMSDYLVGANPAQGRELSQTIARAREAAVRQGVDINSGSREQRLQAVNSVLDQIGQSNKQVSQGGYIGSKPTTRLVPGAEANTFNQNPILPENQPPLVGRDAGIVQPGLPELNTKRVSNLDKVARSTRSIIERQGASGQELAGNIQRSRDTQEIYLGELQKAMPTLTKIARKGKNALVNKDFENFVDATQGLAKPKNATIAKAVQEWQATHPAIRGRAVAAGLDVGDLGPNYYPHFIDYDRVFKDKNTYNEAINHLVKTGQAPTPEEAIKLLGYARDTSRNRQFGNLEASRLVDLPFYDKTPNSLTGYLGGSAKRIAQTETFGAKDEKAMELIKKIGLEGGDTEAAKNAYDVAVGAKQYNPTSSKVSGNIRKYVTTTRLGLGALTNVSQNVNTGIVTGHFRTLGAALKQLNPKTREFVEDTGVIADAVLNDMRTQQGYESFSQKVLGKAINKITAPGFSIVERTNRSIAATAGRDYALRLAQRGKVDTLRKLGVTGEIKGRTLTEAQQIQAARKIVEKTQFKVDPQDLPGWVDSPGGKLVAQFRTFSYNQGKFVSNEILKPLAKGDALPLGRLLAALPLGYALYEARRAIDGRPEEEDKKKVALAAFQKVGGAGLVTDLYFGINPLGSKYLPSDRRVTMALGTFGGPAAGIAAQGIGAGSELAQRKNTPVDESRLEGKVAVGKTDDSYTDATPAARFGLSQIPVVGTPIKNRLLPYKKESEADAGKSTGDKSLDEAIKAAKSGSKDNTKEFNKQFSKQDLALYRLSADQRKELIEAGSIPQEKFEQLDAYANKVKKSMGKDIGSKNVSFKDDGRGSQLVNNLGDMSKADRDKWESKELDPQYQDLYERANKIRFKDLPDLPQNNKVLSLYADLLKKRQGGLTAYGENKAKLAFLKEAYKTDLPKESQEILKASTGDILDGLASGYMTTDQIAQAVQYDNILVGKGLSSSPDIPKKVRDELGLGDAPSSPGAKRKKKGKKSAFKNYSLYGSVDPIKKNRSLRDLVKQATL